MCSSWEVELEKCYINCKKREGFITMGRRSRVLVIGKENRNSKG